MERGCGLTRSGWEELSNCRLRDSGFRVSDLG